MALLTGELSRSLFSLDWAIEDKYTAAICSRVERGWHLGIDGHRGDKYVSQAGVKQGPGSCGIGAFEYSTEAARI